MAIMSLSKKDGIVMIVFFIGVIVVGLLTGLFMPQLFMMFAN
jgi:hypothetical protein